MVSVRGSLFAQLQAIMAWEAYGRLVQISAPTLVIHGENDRLVPPENGRMIAARIPGAKLTIIPQASHIFYDRSARLAHGAILEFLAAQATRKQERTAPFQVAKAVELIRAPLTDK